MRMPPNASLLKPSPKPVRQRFLADSRGEVAIEYTLIAAMTAVIAIGALSLFGDSTTGVWAWISTEVSQAMSGETAESQ